MLKIDIGCGGRGTCYEGFTGLDVWPVPEGGAGYIQRDVVVDGLPFEDGSVQEACCLHVLEHMVYTSALVILQEAYRVLMPGACLYVSTPNLKRMAQKYLEGDEEFYGKLYDNGKPIWKGATLADKFLDSIIGMGEHGHRYAYDKQSLTALGREVGFVVSNVPALCQFQVKDREDHEVLLEFQKPIVSS